MSTKSQHIPVARSFPDLVGHLSARRVFTWSIYLLAAIVLFFIIYPIGYAFLNTFFKDGSITLAPFTGIIQSRGIGSVIVNTAIYTVGTIALAGVIGAFLAWTNERTDARIERLSGLLPILPLMVPPIGTAIGYVILLSDQAGIVNVALRAALGLESGTGPLPILNFPGMIIVTAVTFAPMIYLVVAAALRNVDPALEEASRLFGLSPFQTLLKITLPAVRPALMSAMLMAGIHTLSAFTYPFIFGTGAGITTISVYIYRLFSVFPPSHDKAVAAGMGLLIVVYLALYLQMRIARKAGHSMIGGKHSQVTLVRLGPWRWVLRALMMAYLLAVLLPVAGLIVGSLQPYLGASLSEATLQNFRNVLSNEETKAALWNSFTLGAAAATITMFIAGLLLFVTQRVTRRGHGLVEFSLMTPSVIPHLIIAVAFIVAFSGPPFYLYGTRTLVLIAYCVIFIPDAARAAVSAISQASEELSEASYVSGAGLLRTIRKIVLPQMANGLLAGWVIVFFLSVNEVTASTFLGGLKSTVVGHVAIDYFANGRLGEVAAMALIVTVVTAFFVYAASRTIRKG